MSQASSAGRHAAAAADRNMAAKPVIAVRADHMWNVTAGLSLMPVHNCAVDTSQGQLPDHVHDAQQQK